MTDLKAKKSLGQNFLRSPKAVSGTVNSLNNKSLPVIEIGGGEGVVTAELIKNNFQVIVIELDERAVELMTEKFINEIESGQLQIINADILETDIGKLAGGEEYNLIGNIPYYITGSIIRHIFEQSILPKQITLMVQKEVAERVIGRDGKESILSLSVKVYGEVKMISVVKRGSFVPAPKVDSAIFTVKNINNPFKDRTQEAKFFEIVKTAFKHPRKIALNNLKKYLQADDYTKIEKYFLENNLQQKRAEALSLQNFLQVINLL